MIRCTHKPDPFPYEKAFINQFGNFDYVSTISDLIIKLIEKDAKGIYNVGTDIKSMYDLAKVTKENVKPTTQFPSETTPENVTMNISKMEKFFNTNNDDWWKLDEDK